MPLSLVILQLPPFSLYVTKATKLQLGNDLPEAGPFYTQFC
jgi:hypothetical protein